MTIFHRSHLCVNLIFLRRKLWLHVPYSAATTFLLCYSRFLLIRIFFITDSKGCSKQCMGFIWWKEKTATVKRRLGENIHEQAPSSHCQQIWSNWWLVSQLGSLPELEWKAWSEGLLKPPNQNPGPRFVYINYCTDQLASIWKLQKNLTCEA